ncbi:MAG: response regulator [Desulfobacterales bacterium]
MEEKSNPMELENISDIQIVMDLVSDLICIIDKDGCFTFLNMAWEETVGYAVHTLKGKPYLDFVHPEDREKTETEFKKHLTGYPTPTFESRFKCSDGTFTVLEVRMLSPDQNRILAVARDMTKEKKNEEAIRYNETRFRTLFENALNPIFEIDGDGRFLNANTAALDFLECSRGEIFSKRLSDFSTQKDSGRALKPGASLETGIFEEDYVVNGNLKTLILRMAPLDVEDVKTFCAIGYDVTAFRKEAEEIREEAAPAKIRVLLADDHPVMRDGLSQLLSLQPDIEVVGEASDGKEAVEKTREMSPDVVLMDVNMPNMNGVEATRLIHSEYPDIRIIGLSMFGVDSKASEMIYAGASAYRSKSGNTDLLVASIRGT